MVRHMSENLRDLHVECEGHVNKLCIYILNSFNSNNNYWLNGSCFTEEYNLLKKVTV